VVAKSSIESHRDLIVWQKAMDLTVAVYEIARLLPQHEVNGLRSQMTRAAASVAANIAEGKGRSTARDFANFLHIARGSLAETETFILLAIRLRYIDQAHCDAALGLVDEVGRMLTALRKRLSPR
jgi:four helix bundle protein